LDVNNVQLKGSGNWGGRIRDVKEESGKTHNNKKGGGRDPRLDSRKVR